MCADDESAAREEYGVPDTGAKALGEDPSAGLLGVEPPDVAGLEAPPDLAP